MRSNATSANGLWGQNKGVEGQVGVRKRALRVAMEGSGGGAMHERVGGRGYLNGKEQKGRRAT